MDNSLSAYDEKYANGYGVVYPDGHIVRFFERVLKYKLNKTSGNMLDFGCGNGTHCEYFASKGFKSFGVDIVDAWKNNKDLNFALRGGGFKKILPNQSLLGLFECKFDLIFANQSLYYLPKDKLKTTINELFEMANPNACIFATMMSERNYYFKHASSPDENNLCKVELSGRLNETSYINFIKNADDLKELFRPFETLLLGDYDPINLYDFEGSAHHFIYIGIKK